MSKNRRHELGVGVLVLVALALLAYMALKVGALQGMGDHVDLVTRLPDAAGLADGALVKVAGVDVGRVSSLGIEGGQAIVHLEVQTDAQIRTDAIATVRARSVLGEKFVELLPQSPDAPLAVDGDSLTTAATPVVEIDELVNQIGPLIAALDPVELSKSLKILNDALARDPNRVDRMLTDL
ncbi:MAG: MCE family protein [Oligoflexia bacterium]|nr:MCE family protein [Oligoflexia bacterium]